MSSGTHSLSNEKLFYSYACNRDGSDNVRRLAAIQQDSWEFRKFAKEGSVMPNALVAWDVDNDGVDEIIFGTTEGDFLVVKPEHRKPIFSRVLGATISVVLYSVAYRRLILVTLEGQCEVTEDFLTGGLKTLSSSFAVTRSLQSHDANPASSPIDGNIDCTTASHSGNDSYYFNVPLNCTCGDISTEEEGTMIFLGSDDRRVYVYSIASDRRGCIGSLFVHFPVSSLKCFAVPFAVDSLVHVNNATFAFSSKSTLTSHTTGAPLLLLGSFEEIFFFNASRMDVEQWEHSTLLLTSAADKEDEGKIFANDLYPCGTTVHSASKINSLGLERINQPCKAVLRPLWHTSMAHILQQRQHQHCFPVISENRLHIETFVSSESTTKLSSPDTIYTLRRVESLASLNRQPKERGNTAFVDLLQHGEDSNALLVGMSMKGLSFPVAVDVAVGGCSLQFAVCTEDGRWAIFEMMPFCKNTGSDIATLTSDISNDKHFFIKGAPVSLVCLAFGCFSTQELIPRVKIVYDKNDRFRAIFVASNGTCYVVDGKNNVTIESHVRADASSFTIMKENVTPPLVNSFGVSAGSAQANVATLPSACPAREDLVSQQQLQHGVLCSSSGGSSFLLVFASVDELVISYVDRKAKSTPQQNLASFLFRNPNNVISTQEKNMFKERCNVSSECGTHIDHENNTVAMVDDDDDDDDTIIKIDFEEEKGIMLQLGVALFEAEGFADPLALFSAEELRFAARKLCAVGYSREEWELLAQMDTELLALE